MNVLASFRSIVRWLARLPRRLMITLVRAYQLIVSPHLTDSCRYSPSCSSYAVEAYRRYGLLKGSVLTLWRLLRCQPWGGHGYDPPRWFGEESSDRPDHREDASERPAAANGEPLTF